MFQSYLTGIEIRDCQKDIRIGGGSNRTLLELKYEMKLPESKKMLFQSYLTGIEIKDFAKANFKRNGSNRTLLELKSSSHECNSRPQ